LSPDADYELKIDGQTPTKVRTDNVGGATFKSEGDADTLQRFELIRQLPQH